MTAIERDGLLSVAKKALRDMKDVVTLEGLKCDEFFDALRARTRSVIVTPALIVLSTILTLVFAGGNARVLDLFISAACLLQLGLILERLVGRLAFTMIYVAASAAAAIVGLSASPDHASVGPSGAVFGM